MRIQVTCYDPTPLERNLAEELRTIALQDDRARFVREARLFWGVLPLDHINEVWDTARQEVVEFLEGQDP